MGYNGVANKDYEFKWWEKIREWLIDKGWYRP